MKHLPHRPFVAALVSAGLFAAAPAVASAAPAVTADAQYGLSETATTPVTLTGTGFRTDAPGLYVFYGPDDAPFGATGVGGVKFIRAGGTEGPRGGKLEADGSFRTTLQVSVTGGSGDDAFDCRQVTCSLRTAVAHDDADPTQRTALPITFGPTLRLDRTDGLAVAGDTIRVSGYGFSTAPKLSPTNAGMYVALGGPGFSTSSRSTPSGGAALIDQGTVIAGGGAFTVDLPVKGRFGSGDTAVDCLLVECKLYAWKAHVDADPTQRRQSGRVTFVETPATETPAPPTGDVAPVGTTPPPAAAPPAAAPVVTSPTVPAPRVTRARLSRSKLTFRVSRAGSVAATVQKRVGKRWKRLRTITRKLDRARTVRLNPRLRGTGRFRVVLRVTGPNGERGKTVVVTKRLR